MKLYETHNGTFLNTPETRLKPQSQDEGREGPSATSWFPASAMSAASEDPPPNIVEVTV